MLGVSLGFTALGGIVFGRLADRVGRKAVLQWTILGYSAGALLSGFAYRLWTAARARVVTAVGVGGEWATGQTLVSETFPARRGHYGALMQTGAPLGVGLAAIMGSFFAPAFGWRATFIVSALPALLVTLIRRHMPESDVGKRASRRPSAADLAALLRPPWRRLAGRCLLLTALNMSAYWFTYSWLPAVSRDGAPPRYRRLRPVDSHHRRRRARRLRKLRLARRPLRPQAGLYRVHRAHGCRPADDHAPLATIEGHPA